MPTWKKNQLKLKNKHQWEAKPGHKIVVADRGAVRFDVPVAWVVVPESDSIRIYDKQPPADDCVLGVSYMRLPLMDWSGLPLANLLGETLKGSKFEILTVGEPVELQRDDLEIAWREHHFMDPQEKREAISRICLGRRLLVQSLITFDFWPEDLERCNKVWNTVLETLILAEFVADPTTGRKSTPPAGLRDS